MYLVHSSSNWYVNKIFVVQSQIVLSLLAEVDALHVIATIDHINAPLSEYTSETISTKYNQNYISPGDLRRSLF